MILPCARCGTPTEWGDTPPPVLCLPCWDAAADADRTYIPKQEPNLKLAVRRERDARLGSWYSRHRERVNAQERAHREGRAEGGTQG